MKISEKYRKKSEKYRHLSGKIGDFSSKITKGKNCENFGEISEKVGEISAFIGKSREKSEKVGKNRTNEISVQFSFRGSPKNDISAKYRPKKPKFLSMGLCLFPGKNIRGEKKIIFLP